MVRFAGVDLNFVAPTVDRGPLRTFAHLAFCASAIFRREAAEIIRFGWFGLPDVPEPFSDLITEIA